MIKKAFIDDDGKLNSQNIASASALAIVLVQQAAKIFGFEFHGDTADIMNFVNTLLTMLGVFGLADNTHQIKQVKKEIKEEKNNG